MKFDPDHLARSGPIIIGVSGGPDSLCLLHVLSRMGLPLVVAHLDHALRPESADEASVVVRTAAEIGVPIVTDRRNTTEHASRQGMSLEEAARDLRYRFLFEVAQQRAAGAVCVAHTADDQAETLLMHLLRGAGLDGLRGMAPWSLPNAWSTTIPLIRPLLGVWREEVQAYLVENNLHPLSDPSNQDMRYYRNRLRHETLPYLNSLNPGVRRRLCQTAELLRDEAEAANMEAEAAWRRCEAQVGHGWVSLKLDRLRSEPTAIRRRIMRRGMAALRPGLRDIDYDTVARALHFIDSPPISARSDLAAGLRLESDQERVWLAGWEADLPSGNWPQSIPGQIYQLEVPGEAMLLGGWVIQAQNFQNEASLWEQAVSNANPFQAWLDADLLNPRLLIRNRQPGDRFRPLGLAGHSLKLTDFLINMKMPRRARARWPLVLSDDEIAWVPGYQISDRFALGPQTVRVVRLHLTRMEVNG